MDKNQNTLDNDTPKNRAVEPEEFETRSPNYARIVTPEEAERGDPAQWRRHARGMSPGWWL
jgi:hypothetical protein